MVTAGLKTVRDLKKLYLRKPNSDIMEVLALSLSPLPVDEKISG
jgi:hypothetical protein